MLDSSWLPPAIKGKNKRPVFITGAPRCGSSWVGEVLGNCTGMRYVYEPFNHKWAPALHEHLAHFTYLTSAASPLVTKYATNAFQGRQNLKQLIRAAYRGYLGAATHPASNVVVKDPTASLMSAWISTQFNAKILFVMRHPCGFASSLDALDWQLSVNTLLRQKPLMNEHLEQYRSVLRHARSDKWLTRGAIWAAIHLVYTKQMESQTNWLLYKYEDICENPAKHYVSMAETLGLEMSPKARRKIQSLSTTNRADSGSTRRDSKAMRDIWQDRMSTGEIDAVMGVVSEFGLKLY